MIAEEDLKEAVKHLAFEVYHYRSYAQLVRTVSYARMEPIATQAVLSALLLHLRLLLDFFCTPSKYDDDVCVDDFIRIFPNFAESAPSAITKLDGAVVKEVRINLHKRLVHFTTTRWSDTRKPLNYYMRLFDGLDNLLSTFEEALPDELRQEYQKGLDEWQTKHPVKIVEQDMIRVVPD
jgi:hypothetical protein